MLNRRGIARAVVLLAIIAALLVLAILVPVVLKALDSRAVQADELQEQTAYNAARLRFVQENVDFTALFDNENKQFVDTGTGTKMVTPYGNSKEHEGQVIFVRVDKSGEVHLKWVNPEDYANN